MRPEDPAPKPRRPGWLPSALAAASALLVAVLAVVTNRTTELLPTTWAWVETAWLWWGLVVTLTLVVAGLAAWQVRATLTLRSTGGGAADAPVNQQTTGRDLPSRSRASTMTSGTIFDQVVTDDPTLAMPGYPNLWIPIVDVRDVASAHVLAMTARGAAGQRFLVSSGPAIAMKQIGAILNAHLGDAAKRVPSRSIPNAVVRIASVFSRESRPIVPDLDYVKKVSNEKARRVLHWQPRRSEDAIIATAESLIKKSLVKV